MTTFSDIKLKYELYRLESIILKDLANFIQDGSEPDQWLIDDFKSALEDEAEKIKATLKQSMLYFDGKHVRQAYIQYHQQAIIKLAGGLLNYANPHQLNTISKNPSIQLLAYLIYRSLEELLTFIETHFSKYFDQDAWIPPAYLRIVLHDISRIDEITKNFSALAADKDLVHIATLPLRRFVDAGTSNDATYRTVIYLKQITHELLYLSQQSSPGTINKSLRRLLHTFNFNSPEYFSYCTEYIENELKAAEGSEIEQLHILAKAQKYIHQVQVRPGIALENRPPLSDLLSNWIDEEREFLQKSTQEIDVPTDASAGMFSRFKIIIDINATQLSYFFGVLMAIKIVQNRNKTALSKFIIGIFQTNRTDDVAYDTVRRKFYTKEDSVRLRVKQILQQCLAYIEADTGKFDRK